MAGLVTQTRQKGRGSGLSQGFTFQRFTDTSGSVTIAKPYGCTMLVIECIGAGGGGGTGGGGGGSSHGSGPSYGGAGGSGVIVLRMATANYSGTKTGTSTVTTSGSDTIIKWTGTGSYTA